MESCEQPALKARQPDLLPRLALALASLLDRASVAIRQCFPSDEELLLRVIFGELTPAEAERRAGHPIGEGHVTSLENQDAIRRAAMRFPEMAFNYFGVEHHGS